MVDVIFLSCVVFVVTVTSLLTRAFKRRRNSALYDVRAKALSATPDPGDGIVLQEKGGDDAWLKQMRYHKELYFKLQNLEQHPEILPQSRDLLISLLSQSLAGARKSPSRGILSIQSYTPERLTHFLRSESDGVCWQWERYLIRRKAGRPREMFRDQEEARWWLKQVAPVKYIDGAWLGHVNKITTPFALRRVSKDAWQVLSEELGDGDMMKNHVHVYRELMKEIESGLPDGDGADFISPQYGLDEPHVWKAAVAQLLISLFPHDFFPETLGFNLHFEAITLETLVVAKELKELMLDPYYFVLHISIDNGDSGHTAIALQTVIRYLDYIQSTQGSSAAQQTWRRVQTGYILSDSLPAAPQHAFVKAPAADPASPRNEVESDVIRIFQAKARDAQKGHRGSGMKIGRQTLVDWLEPGAFASREWQEQFLDDLSNMSSLVRKGDSGRSKLIRELSWGGKMFGAFTENEVDIVKRWIDSLGEPDPRLYWSFVGRTEITTDSVLRSRDIRVDYPVFSPISVDELPGQATLSSTLPLTAFESPIKATGTVNASEFFPLWFTHPCLLESFACIPFKTVTRTGSAIIRLLRAQAGFNVEGPGVAGMDEVRRTESVGLVELGLEMMKRCGFPEPGCLKEVLSGQDSGFALTMLHLSMRPMANAGLLLGLAWAFVGLHEAIARSTSTTLLSATSRETLRQISCRERESLKICLDELKDDSTRHASFRKGHSTGKTAIENAFDGKE